MSDVAPVEWTVISGEQAETVLANLTYNEHPAAVRVSPSQGDYGIRGVGRSNGRGARQLVGVDPVRLDTGGGECVELLVEGLMARGNPRLAELNTCGGRGGCGHEVEHVSKVSKS
jgi:hypothetical protein